MRWPGLGAVRVRIPLILLAAGLLLVSATLAIRLQARQAHLLRSSAAHMTRFLQDVALELEAPAADTSAALERFIGQARDAERPFELAGLIDTRGTIVRATPANRTGAGIHQLLGADAAARVLGARDSLPVTIAAPRLRTASVVTIRGGPWRGHRLVMVENLAARVDRARRDELEQALPMLAIGIVLIAAIMLLLDRWLRAPARRIEETANRIAGGDFRARAELGGTGELDRAGRALDRMAEEIERARREQMASRRTTETVLDSLPFAVILTDRDTGRVLFMNARWHENTARTVRIGDSLSDQMANEKLVHLDGTPYRYDELATPIALHTGKPAIVSDIVTVLPDGRRKHESAHAMPVSLQGGRDFDAVLTVVQDRQEIMQLAGELRAWEQRFQRVVEATGQVVYEWDFATATVRRSGNQELVLGFAAEYERAAEARANWESRLHPEDRAGAIAALDESLRTGRPFDAEYRYRRGPGEWITIHDRGYCDMSPEGRILQMSGTMSDVTAAREVEAQLRQAQKMETVGTLAGGVAHDFNNQLTGIIGHLDLLERALDADDERAEHARVARAAAERCAELTRGLLAFSRRLHSQIAPASLNDAVRESVRLLRRALPSSIELEAQLDESLPPACMDVTQIQQVIFNLCINARDAMPEGGRLRLGTTRVIVSDEDRRHPEAYPGAFCRLSVRDDGSGIPQELLGRIFEPFFTTKRVGEGTGLGLSMVYGIVSQHRGWIEVESNPGAGAAFHVFLPATDQAIPTAPARPSPAVPRSAGELVLVVDDEPLLRDLAIRSLEDAGYRTLEAEGGARALELAREHAGELRAVLLDMTMPGMSGLQALPRLLAAAPAVRVVLTSGYSAGDQPPPAGAAGFLAKPWTTAEMVAAVRAAIEGGIPAA